MNKSQTIKNLFDSLSEDYNKRKSSDRVFMNYFNSQRLKVACSSIRNFKNSSVLDLGAGTGFLYDHLKEKGFNTDLYVGVDISSKMLEKSNSS